MKAAAAFLAAAAVVPVTASAAGKLTVLPSGAQAGNVVLEPGETPLGRVATVNVVLRHDGDTAGTLRVRFFPDRGAQPRRLTGAGTAPFPKSHAVLFSPNQRLVAGQLRLRPRRTIFLPLRLGVAEDIKSATLVNGLLVIDLREQRGVRPAVVRLRGALPATASPMPERAPQPLEVTLRVTRWLPLCCDDRLYIAASPRVWVSPGDPSRRALLASDGKDVEVTLTAVEANADAPQGLAQKRLELIGGANAGTYAGEVLVGTSGDQKISVEVKARDLFVWPLLVVGLAATLGGFVLPWWQRRRRRNLLIAELRRARGDYEAAAAGRPPDSPVSPLDGAFSPTAIAELESEIAAAHTSEELDGITETVRGVRDRAKRWIAIEAAARRLLAADEQTPDDAVRRDNREVLARTRLIPADAAEAGELLNRLDRQERLARAFTSAFGRDPTAARDGYIDSAYETEATTADCLDALALVHADIAAFREVYGLDVATEGDARRAAVLRFLGSRPSPGLEAVLISIGDVRPGDTPAQIERGVRLWDRSFAFVTALLTMLVFLVGIYDADFGTWEDYAKALGAGFGGQAIGATAFSLFPALTSYRLLAKKG